MSLKDTPRRALLDPDGRRVGWVRSDAQWFDVELLQRTPRDARSDVLPLADPSSYTGPVLVVSLREHPRRPTVKCRDECGEWTEINRDGVLWAEQTLGRPLKVFGHASDATYTPSVARSADPAEAPRRKHLAVRVTHDEHTALMGHAARKNTGSFSEWARPILLTAMGGEVSSVQTVSSGGTDAARPKRRRVAVER